MNNSFSDYLTTKLQDPAIKREYDVLEPEYTIIHAMIDARKKSGLTQKELADKTGITQGDISKIERGSANPSLNTLKKLADGMNMTLQLVFSPTDGSLPGVARSK